MFLLILKKYWQQIALALAIVAVVYTAYNWAYDRGVNHTTAVYEEKLRVQEEFRNAQINRIEEVSRGLALVMSENQRQTKSDLNKILEASKKEPLTIIKDGNCVPSKNFLDSWNSINSRGNQK